LYDTQQAKNDYNNQKSIYESQKQKVVSLQAKLVDYKADIDAEKKQKEDLLKVTKNDEAKYQSLLASARAEKDAIEGVISSIKLENGTPVTKGQVIAVVGNSGSPICSTGAHLHFEVRVDGNDVNPDQYLKGGVNWGYNYESGQYDYYGTINPRGDWDWPLSEGIKINQGYGSWGFSKTFYGDGIHHGIDMVSDSSDLIKAPKDGTLYRGSTSCSGVTMNYVAVDHGGGIVSWYWHVR
jgi:murein DD-endopeptidase MepM/ murein hydrolase activator NlpD